MAISLNPIKTKTTSQAASSTAKTAAKAAQNAEQISFKRELTDPMGIFMTAMTVYQRIKADAVPVFKEQGVIKGIGATAKAVLAGCANVASDAGLSVILRKLTSFIPQARIANIAFIAGNMLIGGFANRMIDKIFPTKMYDNMGAQNTQIAQDTQSTQTSKASQYSDTFELSTSQNTNNSYDNTTYIPSSTTKTATTNSTNPYNRPVAYVTSDGVTIYEKPDFSVHKYLTQNGGIQKAGTRGYVA